MKKLHLTHLDEAQGAMQDELFSRWYLLKTFELNIADKLAGDQWAHPPLPGAVQYALPGRDGWVRKVFVKYGGKFWDVQKYAEKPAAEFGKLPQPRTQRQQDAMYKRALVVSVAAATKAADAIRAGTCATWKGNATELRKDYWVFPSY